MLSKLTRRHIVHGIKILSTVGVVLLIVGLVAACGDDGPEGEASFLESADGAEVVSPFRVRMDVQGLTVEPAGEAHSGYGHHHIIVDADLPPLDQPVPADDQHLHFGKAQTEAVLDLQPGEHTLRLLFANGAHIPYDPAVTASIKVTVTERRAVFFVEPGDGATVSRPVTVKFGVEGLTVELAGEVNENAGHHHIVIDADLPPGGQPVPSDDQHLHFGKGQTEAEIELAPGEHTLTLVFADGAHIPYDPPITATIKVIVQ